MLASRWSLLKKKDETELSKEKKLEIPSVEARAVPPKQSVAKPKTAVGQPAQDPKTSTPTPTKAPPERSMSDKQELLEVLRLQRDVQRATQQRVQPEHVILLKKDFDEQKAHESTSSGAK